MPAFVFRVAAMTFHLAVSVHAHLPAWLAALQWLLSML
jgi:hypothetical protein